MERPVVEASPKPLQPRPVAATPPSASHWVTTNSSTNAAAMAPTNWATQ